MDIDFQEVVASFLKTLEGCDFSLHLNERYLHHIFSGIVQEREKMSLTKGNRLHPEWATYITGIESRHHGRYHEGTDGFQQCDSNGAPGFIDFAYGDPDSPEVGIEFKMSNGLIDEKALAFDYLKLLDSNNPFKLVYHIAVYFGNNLKEEKIKERHKDALEKLTADIDKTRKRFFYIIIVAGNGSHIVYDADA